MLRFLKEPDQAGRSLVFASATHVWSDLFFSLLVPLLFIMKEDPELDLSFAQVGFLSTVHTGASAVLQVPSGFLAERIGEFWLLLGGNLWAAAGLVAMAIASSYPWLLGTALLGGLGGGTQHPLASSLVSRIYDEQGRSTALGAVNFAGDLGKMVAPVVALLVAPRYGWRATMWVVGLAGMAFMMLAGVVRRGGAPPPVPSPGVDGEGASAGSVETAGFVVLSLVGFLDSSARRGALVFMPFLLRDKGMSAEQVIGLTFLLLAGGAAGKLVCGWLDERYGSVSLIWGTKGLTAALLVAALYTPVPLLAPLMVLLGIGLNGTSSVLYATVAAFVPLRLRARYYGIFYTTNEGGTTLAPVVYGLLADLLQVRTTLVIMALVTTLVLPASLPLRKYLPSRAAAPRGRTR